MASEKINREAGIRFGYQEFRTKARLQLSEFRSSLSHAQIVDLEARANASDSQIEEMRAEERRLAQEKAAEEEAMAREARIRALPPLPMRVADYDAAYAAARARPASAAASKPVDQEQLTSWLSKHSVDRFEQFQFVRPTTYKASNMSIDHKYWVEIKYDGNRAVWDGMYLRSSSLGFWVRPPDFWTANMPKNAVLDGELWMHSLEDENMPDMHHVSQLWKHKNKKDIYQDELWQRALFFAFDLVGGTDVRKLPFYQRRKLLDAMSALPESNRFHLKLDKGSAWFFPETVDSSTPLRLAMGKEFLPPFDQRLKEIRQRNPKAEGVVVKRMDSTYNGAQASTMWTKYKFYEDIECRVVDTGIEVPSRDNTTLVPAIHVEHPVEGNLFYVSVADNKLLQTYIPVYRIVNIAYLADPKHFMRDAKLRWILPPETKWKDIQARERAKASA